MRLMNSAIWMDGAEHVRACVQMCGCARACVRACACVRAFVYLGCLLLRKPCLIRRCERV